MIYTPNNANVIRTATLAATNIVASEAIERVAEVAEGGGVVSLAGPYTGQDDTLIDVEFTDTTTSGTPRVSEPVFSGVGDGRMRDIAPGTLDPQAITVTAIDLGTDTRFAVARFGGARLVARIAGDTENEITVEVDDSAIVEAPSDYATTQAIAAGDVDMLGEAFDFGGPALTVDGQVPVVAPRVRFGDDPQVYRVWRRWRNDQWAYNLSPAPVRDIPAGVPLYLVSGTYTVRVRRGITVRTYAGLVTIYDALDAMRADASGLCSPVDPVVLDRSPLGMATLDITDRTAPFVVALRRSGSRFVVGAEIGYTPSASAPSESVTIECFDAAEPGRERWRVNGSGSGPLAEAVTGILYNTTIGSFRVPVQQNEPPGSTARISFSVAAVPRGAGASQPCINLSRLVLGARARTRDITFTLQPRPRPDCDCTDQPILGGPNAECLGLEPPGGEDMDLTPMLRRRAQRITQWSADVVQRRGGVVDGDQVPEWSGTVRDWVLRELGRIDGGTPLRTAWTASTEMQAGTIRRPVTPNGYIYEWQGLAAATTGATQPTWPTTIGSTVVDGGVTWTAIGRDTETLLDELLDRIEGEWRVFDLAVNASSAQAWVASTTFGGASAGAAPEDPVTYRTQFVAPTTANGRLYVAVRPRGNNPPGTTAATEPSWPTTDYATVTDGGVTWMALPRYWTASQVVAKGAVRVLGFGMVARAIVGGTTGGSEPTWFPRDSDGLAAGGREIVDGGVTWRLERATRQNRTMLFEPPANGFTGPVDFAPGPANIERYLSNLRQLIGPAYVSAGLLPFDSASAQGSRCWRDVPDATEWWVPSDPSMLPAFTGVYYHAVRRRFNAAGEEIIEDTQEFGFGIQACDTVQGDSFTVRVEAGPGSTGGETYRIGDKIEVDVIRAVPIPFGGGQTGTDEITWRVLASEDGGLSNYVLDKITPNAYSDASGLAFQIELGGVPFALGDTFRFEIEGGRFRWRRDGGAWSALAPIGANVALADGLKVTFAGGEAPSFVAGDTWSFRALAVNGPGRLRQPTPGRLASSAATTITASSVVGAVRLAVISDHAIPSDATITLEASTLADFSVLAYSAVIPWSAADIVHELPSAVTAANWRLVVNRACAVGWLWMGQPLALSNPRGSAELGVVSRRVMLPRLAQRVRTGVEVRHEAMARASVDALLSALAHACTADDRLLGVVVSGQHHRVRVDADMVEIDDRRGHQPTNPDAGIYSTTLTLEAA